MEGFIKLPRTILDWEWYQHPTTSRVYFHLILRANYTDKRWQGTAVKRGQLITSINHLANELNLSFQKIRTATKKLESSGYINTQSTNRFTLITIVHYENMQAHYNLNNKQNNNLTTKKKQTLNKQITTTKKGKNSKEYNKDIIESRKNNFKNDVFKHSQFSNKILNDFFKYWSEIDSKSRKMKFEKQAAFEITVRLEKWIANEFDFLKTTKTNNTLSTNR